MNLQFTNKGGNFVSEFEVTSDFNLHIEGVRLSDMRIGQKTAGGSYAEVTDFPSERSQDRVADFDFASLVYPKFIKVVCATEPTYAEIATDGEVTEIKSQSKEVEIVSNGVTEIAPDAGFGYLSGVKVNVNVPTGGGGEGGDTIKYIDPSKSQIAAAMVESAILIKLQLEGGVIIVPMAVFVANRDSYNVVGIIGASVDLDAEFVIEPGGQLTSIRKNLNGYGITNEQIDSIPYITKEEFYTI